MATDSLVKPLTSVRYGTAREDQGRERSASDGTNVVIVSLGGHRARVGWLRGWRTDVWFGRLEVQQEGERADVREPPRVHATAGGVDAPASLHPGGSVAPSGCGSGGCV